MSPERPAVRGASSFRLPRAWAASAIVSGLILATLPAAAHAGDAPTPVTFTVSISDGTDSAALSGVHISVRDPYADGEVLASGTSGADGRASLSIGSGAAQDVGTYVADAVWPGATGDLDNAEVRTEFVLDDPSAVDITFWGGFGTIDGAIAATIDGESATDLSGATIAVLSGGVEVQRTPVAADGTFSSGALPSTGAEDYQVLLTPPSGLELAEHQPSANPPFRIAAGSGSQTVVDIAREFALVSLSPQPTPTPDPTPTPTPTPTPDPTPTPEPTPDPTPTPTPGSSSAYVYLEIAAFHRPVTDDLVSAPDSAVTAMLDATRRAGGDVVALMNQMSQVVGFAQESGADSADPADALMPIMDGVTRTGPAVAATDLQTALEIAQTSRTSELQQQLTDRLLRVQERNQTIATSTAALSALDSYRNSPTRSRFDAAVAAMNAASITDPFVDLYDEGEPDLVVALTEAARAASALRAWLDAATGTQHTDALRIQQLANKQNEAIDLMDALAQRLRDSHAGVIAGTMRSTPVSLGSVQWNRGVVTGGFDLSDVPAGDHHLFLNFADAGFTTITDVAVEHTALAATGAEPTVMPWVGSGLVLLGTLTIAWSSATNRRHRRNTRARSL